MSRKSLLMVVGALVAFMILLPKGWGQTNEERIKALEEAVKKLQQENAALRQEVSDLKTQQGVLTEDEVAMLKKLGKGFGSKKLPAIEPYLTSFAQYTYRSKGDASQPNDYNAFEITRLYLGQWIHFRDDLRGRVTLDAGIRDDDTTGTVDFDVVLRHAYLEYKGWPHKNLTTEFGQIDLPWVSYLDGIWGRRYSGTSFEDREGYLTGTDLGIGLKWKIPDDIGDAHITLTNSEGWRTPEANKYKALEARLTIKPLPKTDWWKNWNIAGFIDWGYYTKDQKRSRVIPHIFYKGEKFTWSFNYLFASDPNDRIQGRHPRLQWGDAPTRMQVQGDGWSSFATWEFTKDWTAVARVDHINPSHFRDDGHTRYIIGLEHKFTPNIRAMLNYEYVDYDTRDGESTRTFGEDVGTIGIHTEIKY